jgi:hypothetical protein
MKTITWLMLSLTFILSAGLVAPAAARIVRTSCVGELANLTVRGDLIVPEGEQCQLIHVTVRGNVRVNERATLEVIESRINAALTGAHFERVSLQDSSVGQRVRLIGGVSVELVRTTIEDGARLVDQIDARVLQSRVTGPLVVRGTREVALVCGSTVEGDARFTDNRGGLLIGGDPALCAANEVQGHLRLHHNQSETTVAHNTIGQNLVCAANDPAPTAFDNQVGGTTRGQCGTNEPVDATELTDSE